MHLILILILVSNKFEYEKSITVISGDAQDMEIDFQYLIKIFLNI